jgi:hypothetical protein
MKLEQVRPAVLRVTLHAVELGSLIAAARWAADGGREELPAEARAQLQDLLRRYESELAGLNRAASSSRARRECGDD